MTKGFGFRVVPVHPGHARLHKLWPRFHEHHNHWCRVLGVRVRPGTRHFPYNENSTIALNTTSLKFCLPSTDAIDSLEKKSHMRVKVKGRLIKRASLKSTRFSQKSVGYISNRPCICTSTSMPLVLQLCSLAQSWANHLAHVNTFYYRNDRDVGQNLFCRPTNSIQTDVTGNIYSYC
jgi:hypothetical protein